MRTGAEERGEKIFGTEPRPRAGRRERETVSMTEPRFAAGPEDLVTREELAGMSGLDFIRGMLEGRLPHPPIAGPMGMRLIEAEAGRVVFEAVPGFRHYNPLGAVHGGWFGTVLDSAGSCAVQTMMPAGQGYTTLEYKVNMLRAVSLEAGALHVTGEVLRVGRRTGVAEARVADAFGRSYATGLVTCLVFDLEEEA
mgnify:FL=1